MAENRTTIVLVGQTPPPFLGQAMMIERTLRGEYGDHIRLVHVRMGFSRATADIGKFSVLKIYELFRVIFGIYRAYFQHHAQVLYYFPAGPKYLPIFRDIVILFSTRWLFKKTIFHFRASGLSECYDRSPGWIKLLMRLAYFRPDIGIRLSEYTPEDAKKINAVVEVILPNGVEDPGPPQRQKAKPSGVVEIIFLGAITEAKGIDYLLDACFLLNRRGNKFKLTLVGEFDPWQYRKKVKRLIISKQLGDLVSLPGVLTGSQKAAAFSQADILCNPTFFHSEALPGVILEAMSYGLPVVATRWRGIPSLIDDGRTGFMVPIKDANALAEKLEILIKNPDLRWRMGMEGRERFLQHFTLPIYYQNLRKIFESLC